MPYEEFTRRHGSDKGDSDYWGWKLPETPFGRLKVLGFLVEGTVGGRECVLIPFEIREALRVAFMIGDSLRTHRDRLLGSRTA